MTCDRSKVSFSICTKKTGDAKGWRVKRLRYDISKIRYFDTRYIGTSTRYPTLPTPGCAEATPTVRRYYIEVAPVLHRGYTPATQRLHLDCTEITPRLQRGYNETILIGRGHTQSLQRSEERQRPPKVARRCHGARGDTAMWCVNLPSAAAIQARRDEGYGSCARAIFPSSPGY